MNTDSSYSTAGSAPPPAATPSSLFWQRFRDLGSFRRASRSRVFAGVAEGLSRHFDIDAVIIRVLFVALAFFGCAGILLYVVLWLTVPRDDQVHSVLSGRRNRDPRPVITAGLAIGGVLAAAVFLGSISWAVPHPFPVLVLVAAVALVVIAFARRRDAAPPSPPPTLDSSAFQIPESAPPETDESRATAPAWWQRTEPPPLSPSLSPPPPAPPTLDLPVYAPPPPAPPTGPKSHLFAITVATIALAIAALWIADASTSWDPNPSVYPGVALGIIAAALLVSVRWGRSRSLIVWGFVAALATAVAGFAGPGPYGDFVHAPTRAAQLRSSYDIGAGQLTLQLQNVADVARLDGHTTTLDARFGRIVLVIPSSVAATVDANVDHGEVVGVTSWTDLNESGQHAVLPPPPDGRPTMRINVHVTYGQIEILRAACPGPAAPLTGESVKLWKGDTRVAAACN